MNMNTEELRCYWCDRPTCYGAGGVIRNIAFCWQSAIVPFEICGEIRKKIDTLIDDFECPVCLETKQALEMPRCNHKVCLDCYKTIYFGTSECEKPCIYRDCNYPEWTYELQLDENGEIIENEKENEHGEFLVEKINYYYTDDYRTYDELIKLRNNLCCERPEWMNSTEVINYENNLFKICSEYKTKGDRYLSKLTIGNKSCPLCRKCVEY